VQVSVRHVIAEALREVFGHNTYVPSLYGGKLKDGTRVYRITGGSGTDYLYKRDGKVWLRPGNMHQPKEPVHITEEMARGDYQRDDLSFNKWEWHLLNHGPRAIEGQLQAAIKRRGVHNVEVQIGTGHSSYPHSMAFKVIGKQGPSAELALLFSSLPSAGSHWPADERKRWIETAERMFDLMYGPV
jgi:hypothetical protein